MPLSLFLFVNEAGSIVEGEEIVLESGKPGFNLSSAWSSVALKELLTFWSLHCPICPMRMIMEPTLKVFIL